MTDQPQYISLVEAVARLQAQGYPARLSTMRRWCQEGKLPSIRLGNRWLVLPKDVDAIPQPSRAEVSA